jgi:hypothetical protein
MDISIIFKLLISTVLPSFWGGLNKSDWFYFIEDPTDKLKNKWFKSELMLKQKSFFINKLICEILQLISLVQALCALSMKITP